MIITRIEIQKHNKNKLNMFIDDEFCSGIHCDVFVKYDLKVGKELEQAELDAILFESDKILALNQTVNYISTSLKTKKQIREYIYGKGYSKEVSEYVVSKLLEYKYLDDELFARAYISTYEKKYGKFKLKTNLLEKGVDKEIVENLLNSIESDENILYNLVVKYMKNKENTFENQVKLSRFLSGRGFSFDEINSVVEKLKKGELC